MTRPGSDGSTDMSLCALNVNSHSYTKLSCILAVLLALEIDVMLLMDTGTESLPVRATHHRLKFTWNTY